MAVICPSCHCECHGTRDKPFSHSLSLRSRVNGCGNPFPFFEGYYGFFRAYHSCGAQKLFSLGARTTFDRGARRCSLLPAPQALTTSLRMTHNLVIANTCGVRLYFRLPVIASDKPFYIFLKILTCLFCFLQFSITYFVPCDSPSQNANTSSA